MNLEKFAWKLTTALFAESDISQGDLAKIEYGFSLTLGVAIGLMSAVVIASFLGNIFYTMLIMFSALGVRLFTGGAHCSTYARCLVLTLLVFIPAGLVVRAMIQLLAADILLWVYGAQAAFVLLYLARKGSRSVLLVAALNLGMALSTIWLGGWPQLNYVVSSGFLIQILFLTRVGSQLVKGADLVLKKVGL